MNIKRRVSKLFVICIFLCTFIPIYAAESLVNALTNGKFSGNIDARYKEGSNDNGHQKFLLEYDLPKVNDVDVKLGVQSLKDENQEDTSTNQTFYTEATYAQKDALFDYQLSANYFGTLFSPNEETHTVTSQAIGLKAEASTDDVEGYLAVSKVSDNAHDLYVKPSINGKEKFLPTSSLLISNNDTPNTTAAAADIKYHLNKGVLVGSRYTIAKDDAQINSYSGVYSSFALKNVLEGLKVTVAYDKAIEGDDAKQWSLKFKNNF